MAVDELGEALVRDGEWIDGEGPQFDGVHRTLPVGGIAHRPDRSHPELATRQLDRGRRTHPSKARAVVWTVWVLLRSEDVGHLRAWRGLGQEVAHEGADVGGLGGRVVDVRATPPALGDAEDVSGALDDLAGHVGGIR